MTYDDLPIIQLPPGPSDAELEADRDAKHEAAVKDWLRRQAIAETIREAEGVVQAWPFLDGPDDHIPPQRVIG